MQYIVTSKQAEVNAMNVMRSWGYVDATSPSHGADGGIDVRSSRALAQVKWRGGVAGRPDLQRLFGARAADSSKALFFFAASGYSKAAVTYANQVGMSLYVYDPTGKVHAVNKWDIPAPKGAIKANRDSVFVAAALVVGAILAIALFTIVAGSH